MSSILFLLLILNANPAFLSSAVCYDVSGNAHPVVTTNNGVWITSPENHVLFRQTLTALSFGSVSDSYPVIEVDTAVSYQEIDGFGNCLTGGSATLLHRMDQTSRSALLKELFSTDGNNIGISYLRISIGASDLSDHVFSYDDMPDGESDPDLVYFTIEEERKDLIPILKEILAINPAIKILGSPWSAPVWMKTNRNSKGGSLKPEFYDAYAQYFIKYLKAMKEEGIDIDAITIQNEPLHPGNNPSMYMTSSAQADFIKKSLGPAFRAEEIKTKIIVYDHNCDKPGYPIDIYKDNEAAEYVDGAAFHMYTGSIDALSTVHDSFPSKNLYFTEQWVGAPGNLAGDLSWHIKTLVIGATRNWSKNVLEWNLASDPYILAHCAKFVRPGSVRIASNVPDGLPNVAFRTPDGKIVIIVLNESGTPKNINLRFGGKTAALSLDKGAVATCVW
jgi:glucosylceramidase